MISQDTARRNLVLCTDGSEAAYKAFEVLTKTKRMPFRLQAQSQPEFKTNILDRSA